MWRQALHSDFGRGFNGLNFELPRITNSRNSQKSQNRRIDTLPHLNTTDPSSPSLAYEHNLTNTPQNHPNWTGQKWNWNWTETAEQNSTETVEQNSSPDGT